MDLHICGHWITPALSINCIRVRLVANSCFGFGAESAGWERDQLCRNEKSHGCHAERSDISLFSHSEGRSSAIASGDIATSPETGRISALTAMLAEF